MKTLGDEFVADGVSNARDRRFSAPSARNRLARRGTSIRASSTLPAITSQPTGVNVSV